MLIWTYIKATFTHTRVRVRVRVRVALSELPVTRTRATRTSGAFTTSRRLYESELTRKLVAIFIYHDKNYILDLFRLILNLYLVLEININVSIITYLSCDFMYCLNCGWLHTFYNVYVQSHRNWWQWRIRWRHSGWRNYGTVHALRK